MLSRNIKIFCFFLIYRILNSFILQTIFEPDEIWQNIEPINYILHGKGEMTWDWMLGIRSFNYVIIYFIPCYILNRTFPSYYHHFCPLIYKIINGLLSAICDHYTVKLFLIHSNKVKNIIFITVFSHGIFLYSPRSHINSFEMLCCVLITYFLESYKNNKIKYKNNYLIGVIIASFIVYLRPTALFFVFPQFLFNIQKALRHLHVGFCVLIFLVTVDCVAYGEFVFPPFNFFKINIYYKVSDLFGKQPWYLYFIFLFVLTGILSIVFIHDLFSHYIKNFNFKFAKSRFWNKIQKRKQDIKNIQIVRNFESKKNYLIKENLSKDNSFNDFKVNKNHNYPFKERSKFNICSKIMIDDNNFNFSDSRNLNENKNLNYNDNKIIKFKEKEKGNEIKKNCNKNIVCKDIHYKNIFKLNQSSYKSNRDFQGITRNLKKEGKFRNKKIFGNKYSEITLKQIKKSEKDKDEKKAGKINIDDVSKKLIFVTEKCEKDVILKNLTNKRIFEDKNKSEQNINSKIERGSSFKSSIYSKKNNFVMKKTGNNNTYKLNHLSYICILYLLLYSFIGHKEMRFLLPIIPFVNILTANLINKKIKIIIIVQLIVSIFIGLTHQNYSKVIFYLKNTIETEKNVNLFYCVCPYSLPAYSYLCKKNITIKTLTGNPNISKKISASNIKYYKKFGSGFLTEEYRYFIAGDYKNFCYKDYNYIVTYDWIYVIIKPFINEFRIINKLRYSFVNFEREKGMIIYVLKKFND